MEFYNVKLINVKYVDLVGIVHIANGLMRVQISQSDKVVFQYDFLDIIKATKFTEQISHSHKENILFDPIRFIKSNNLDK